MGDEKRKRKIKIFVCWNSCALTIKSVLIMWVKTKTEIFNSCFRLIYIIHPYGKSKNEDDEPSLPYSLEQPPLYITFKKMVVYRKKDLVVAAAVAASIIVIVKNVRKKLVIQKAVAARNIMMNLKRRPYSPRIMEERPPYELSTWGRILTNPRYQDPADKRGGILFRRRFRVSYPMFQLIVELMRENRWFSDGPDCVGRRAAPLELKILESIKSPRKRILL